MASFKIDEVELIINSELTLTPVWQIEGSVRPCDIYTYHFIGSYLTKNL